MIGITFRAWILLEERGNSSLSRPWEVVVEEVDVAAEEGNAASMARIALIINRKKGKKLKRKRKRKKRNEKKSNRIEWDRLGKEIESKKRNINWTNIIDFKIINYPTNNLIKKRIKLPVSCSFKLFPVIFNFLLFFYLILKLLTFSCFKSQLSFPDLQGKCKSRYKKISTKKRSENSRNEKKMKRNKQGKGKRKDKRNELKENNKKGKRSEM